MSKPIIASWLERYGAPPDVAAAGAALSAGLAEGQVQLRGPELSRSPLVCAQAAGGPSGSANAPLVAHAGNWQFQRYAQYERRLAERLRVLAEGRPGGTPLPVPQQEAMLDELFPKRKTDHAEARQAETARGALRARLTVIAGGPGTGKTTTVVRLVALMQAARNHVGTGAGPRESVSGGEPWHEGTRDTKSQKKQPLRLGLLAPTGKAAARLAHAFRQGHTALPETLRPLTAAEAEAMDAQTIHRALGVGNRAGRPRCGRTHPIPFDLIIVDEASMVDLALMTLLFEAVADDAHVVLIGDPQQLAAIEPGAPFADLVARLTRENGSCFHLEHSFRFGARPGIGAIAEVLSRGDSTALTQLLRSPPAGLSHLPELREEVWEALERLAYAGLSSETTGAPLDSAQGLSVAFARLERTRALCVHRKGPLGTSGINHRLARRLNNTGRAQQTLQTTSDPLHASLIPIIFTQNQSELGVSNGDEALLLKGRGHESKIWLSDGRHIATVRAPEFEPAFALTVHKAQGSEFDHVFVILPDKDSPHLTRELLYTAVTRARVEVTLVGRISVLAQALTRQTLAGAAAGASTAPG